MFTTAMDMEERMSKSKFPTYPNLARISWIHENPKEQFCVCGCVKQKVAF